MEYYVFHFIPIIHNGVGPKLVLQAEEPSGRLSSFLSLRATKHRTLPQKLPGWPAERKAFQGGKCVGYLLQTE